MVDGIPICRCQLCRVEMTMKNAPSIVFAKSLRARSTLASICGVSVRTLGKHSYDFAINIANFYAT